MGCCQNRGSGSNYYNSYLDANSKLYQEKEENKKKEQIIKDLTKEVKELSDQISMYTNTNTNDDNFLNENLKLDQELKIYREKEKELAELKEKFGNLNGVKPNTNDDNNNSSNFSSSKASSSQATDEITIQYDGHAYPLCIKPKYNLFKVLNKFKSENKELELPTPCNIYLNGKLLDNHNKTCKELEIFPGSFLELRK